MEKFQRTTVGGLSVSRMIIGTNWFLGYSHTSKGKDMFIKNEILDIKKVADMIEVFFKQGVDTIMGPFSGAQAVLINAVKEAEDRTGVKAIIVSTPTITIGPSTPSQGFDIGEAERVLDEQVKLGVSICMPHQSTTDSMVDRCTREIRHMDSICKMIRERNMHTGLSTHMPESIIYADETDLDVDTYISLYNAMGFLMQVEVDWVSNVIQNAKKPVMTIKPLAAGQLRPFQALNFVWNTIRPQDMVTIGTMSTYEAEECIEMSNKILHHEHAVWDLQETRSKASIISHK